MGWFGLAVRAPIRNPGGSGLGLSDEFAYLPWGAPSPGVPLSCLICNAENWFTRATQTFNKADASSLFVPSH